MPAKKKQYKSPLARKWLPLDRLQQQMQIPTSPKDEKKNQSEGRSTFSPKKSRNSIVEK